MRFIELDKDYDVISSWWKSYKFPVIPREALPKNGFIIDETCAGFIYSTDSSISWLEFVVANPSLSKEERKQGLQKLLLGLTGLAKELGYSIIFSSVNHSSLMERYKEVGFEQSDTNMTNFIRRL